MNTSFDSALPASEARAKKPILKQAPYPGSFLSYLGEKRRSILIMIVCMSAGFFLFKLCYPFPDFFSDSYSYIYAAKAHLDVNIWPIGYSRFLSWNSWFTHSPAALIWFQFLFFGASFLYLYHTIAYFYTTGTVTRGILFVFVLLNPLYYYLANYVTTDCLFAGMSMIWLSQMIWILNRPRLYQVFLQAFLMFVMFTFRYNAMVYPLIAALVFIVSRQPLWTKVLGIVSGPILIIPFVIWTSQAAKKMTGTAQFPPIIGGWQWANNALYIRPFVYIDTNSFPSPATAELDRMARKFYQSLPLDQRDIPYKWEAFFIVHPAAPLKQYKARHYQPKDQTESVTAWGKVAPVFNEYGHFIVRQHPMAFVRYYVLPNIGNYFVPFMGKFTVHNMGGDSLWPGGQEWFRYASPRIWSISKDGQNDLLIIFPYIFLFLNIYFALGLLHFLRRGGIRKSDRVFNLTLLTVTTFVLLNFAFSVTANSVTLRYEVFPMIVLLAISMLMTDWLEAHSNHKTSSGPATAARKI